MTYPKLQIESNPSFRIISGMVKIEGQLKIGGVCFPTHANTAKGLETAVKSNHY